MIAQDEEPVADLASRMLSGLTAVVSQRSREWGLAMQAELATIDGAATRLRFAGGCVRALVCDRRLMWTLASRIALAAVAVTILIFTALASVGVAVEAAVVVVLLGGLSWRGR